MEENTPDIELIHKRDIKEISTFDRDQTIAKDDLGDDWGDGFYVQPEAVVVQRGSQGEILRTTPLSEWDEQHQEEMAPLIAEQKIQPTPISRADRDKLVYVLASRLFKWYASQPKSATKYNPIYDGIPDVPSGSPENLQPLPGTNLYPASPNQIMEWLKTQVIGPRVRIQNLKRGLDGYQPQLTISRKVN